MIKKIHFTRSLFIAALAILLLIPGLGWGANFYSIADGNWSTSGLWSDLSGGDPITEVPGSSDNVFIEGGYIVIIADVVAACENLSIASGSQLIVGNINFDVSGTTSIYGTLTHNNITGTKTFMGLVTINIGGVWDNTVDEAITFRGGITNNGTFNAGTGNQTFSSNSQALTGNISIPRVRVTGVTLTNNGTLTCATVLSGTGGLTNAASAILNIGGTSPITNLTATSAGNLVNYTGSDQTVHLNDYSNLTLSGNGIKTFTNSLTISNNLQISSGVLANLGSSNIHTTLNLFLNAAPQVAGSYGGTGSGATNINTTYFTATSGILYVNTCVGKWVGGTNTNWHVGSNWCDGVVPTASTNVEIPSGGNQPVISASAVCNTLIINIGATLTISGSNTLNIHGILTNDGTITANSGIITLNSHWINTGTFNDVASTVIYNGANQTCAPVNYHNLTLSGINTKTFATTPTVNGILSIEGSSIVITVTTGFITYGPNATLQYNTSIARNASNAEWISPFAATGGVIIANTGTISLNVGKVFNTGIPLTINSGASLNTNSKNLTLGGDFHNNGGTFTSTTSQIIITGSSAQSIDGFATADVITVSKTGGVATITGNVSASALTYTTAAMNGATVSLNPGVSMTLSGAFTMNRPGTSATTGSVFAVNTGSLSCASLSLSGTTGNIRTNTLSISTGSVTSSGNISSAGVDSKIVFTGAGTLNAGTTFMSGTPGTFTAGTGTINYNGAGAQNVSTYVYNNLTLSGGNTKTFLAATTIAGKLSIASGTTASLGTGLTSTANTMSLGGVGTLSGTWGSTSSAASHTNNTYFSATNGIVTVNTSTCTSPIADAGPPAVFGLTGVPYNFPGASYSNGTFVWTMTTLSGAPGSFVNTGNIQPTFTPAATGSTRFVLTVTNDCDVKKDTLTVYVMGTDPMEWSGSIGNDWYDYRNWAQLIIPTSDYDVLIPSVGIANFPTINTAGAVCKNITIESGASLIDNGNLTLSGSITVQHPALSPGKWHLISSPVSDVVSGMFTGQYLRNFNNSTGLYENILAVDVPLTAMHGYALWQQAGNFTTAYVGGLNKNASYSVATGTGWNLVGNPYPSAIDWKASGGWTKTNVNDATYVRNADAGNWRTYINGVSANGGSRYIAPSQGFFINASASGGLAMTNAVRVHNNVGLYKSSDAVISELVRLEVSGNGYKDEAVVRFTPEATSEFDGEFDAYKLYGDIAESAQLYTLGSVPVAINSLPETTMVSVGIKIGANGSYTIAATEINDLLYVTLEDSETGIFTDLATSSYTFDAVTGTFDQRFILHFNDFAVSVDETKSIAASVFSYQKTVHINMKNQEKGDIFIYNIAGQLVASKHAAQGMNEIGLQNTGNYIVKVIGRNGIVVRKIFIK